MTSNTRALAALGRLREHVAHFLRSRTEAARDAFDIAMSISLTLPGELLAFEGYFAISPPDACPSTIFFVKLRKGDEVYTLGNFLNLGKFPNRGYFASFIHEGARMYAIDTLAMHGCNLKGVDFSKPLQNMSVVILVTTALPLVRHFAHPASLEPSSNVVGVANGTLSYYSDSINTSVPYFKYNWRQAAFIKLGVVLRKALETWKNQRAGGLSNPYASTQQRPLQAAEAAAAAPGRAGVGPPQDGEVASAAGPALAEDAAPVPTTPKIVDTDATATAAKLSLAQPHSAATYSMVDGRVSADVGGSGPAGKRRVSGASAGDAATATDDKPPPGAKRPRRELQAEGSGSPSAAADVNPAYIKHASLLVPPASPPQAAAASSGSGSGAAAAIGCSSSVVLVNGVLVDVVKLQASLAASEIERRRLVLNLQRSEVQVSESRLREVALAERVAALGNEVAALKARLNLSTAGRASVDSAFSANMVSEFRAPVARKGPLLRSHL